MFNEIVLLALNVTSLYLLLKRTYIETGEVLPRGTGRIAVQLHSHPISQYREIEGFSMGMPVIQPGTMTREESVADIIDSIAAEESAIAHILNAESEKLQAVIDSQVPAPAI